MRAWCLTFVSGTILTSNASTESPNGNTTTTDLLSNSAQMENYNYYYYYYYDYYSLGDAEYDATNQTNNLTKQEKFCNQESWKNLTFPRTSLGVVAVSEELCETGDFSKATAICLNSDSPLFQRFQLISCNITLDMIHAILTDQSNVNVTYEVASNTLLLTSNPAILNSSNVTQAAGIINWILTRNTSNMAIATASVTTLSQLLSVNRQLFLEPNSSNSFQRLTNNMESFLLNKILLKRGNASVRIVQPKLVVQTVQVPSNQTTGIQFSLLSNNSTEDPHIFRRDRITVQPNMLQLMESGCSTDMQIFIRLFPSGQTEDNTNNIVGFTLYENDAFFQSKIFNTSNQTSRNVISAIVKNASVLDEVKLSFRPTNVSNLVLNDFACVSWDYDLKDWTTRGCFKGNISSENLLCHCNHTTNFAVLVSYRQDYKYAEALSIISTVGCVISIFGLGFTIIYQIITRKSRSFSPTVMLVSICVSMMIFYILFLLGTENPNANINHVKSQENIIPSSDLHQNPDEGPCTIFTALMQYFLLATFTWNTLYGAHIFLVMKYPLSGPPSWFFPFSLVMGWVSDL
ncbi:adhesion G-protein coupled receptor G7-like isoform X2 [Denticeps clupeoides]|uniref:adhesion G-protein coupled receptor G7-like isoform X2 n=1 Tax=Denticeps clupeoides TaxID=299321 RepID=UPI0010A2B4FE|nr:adhesion G-protein coupled receptor G7-like isoform X2 [Denticeps clupeoides]